MSSSWVLGIFLGLGICKEAKVFFLETSVDYVFTLLNFAWEKRKNESDLLDNILTFCSVQESLFKVKFEISGRITV
jgi:hypothetical protein